MQRPYQQLVEELIAHIEHVMKYPEQKKPVYVYIRQENMCFFVNEAISQFSKKYMRLTVSHLGDIERYLATMDLIVFFMVAATYTEDAPYLRYESIGPVIIFNDCL